MEAAADGATNLALAEMIDPGTDGQWQVDGSPRILKVGAYEISIATRDEAGKVDINNAPTGMLKALAESAGMPGHDADAAINAIERHRGRRYGDGDAQPTSDGAPATILRSVDEAASTAAFPPAAWNCLRPYLTVYTGLDGVDQRYASNTVLQALAKMLLAPTTQSGAVARGDPGPTSSLAGKVLALDASLHGEEGNFRSRIVVRLTGDPKRMLLIGAWDMDAGDDPGASCPP